MDDESLFALLNYSVLPAWLLLAALPRWKGTRWVVHSGAYPVVLGLAYAILLFTDQPGPQGASFWTLEGVTRIFTTPHTIIACWLHYLIFDLFVGSWIARDAQRLGIRHAFVLPSLVLTLMFGPVGLISWLGVRAVARRRFLLLEATSDAADPAAA